MRFYRKQHDGLWGVINRKGKKTITFTNKEYETKSKEEIEHLIDLGYSHDVPTASELGLAEEKTKQPKVSWVVREIESGKELEIFEKKKDAADWLTQQDNATELELERQVDG